MVHSQVTMFGLMVIAGLLALLVWLWFRNKKLSKDLDRFRRLADEAHDLIWIIDRDGRILYISNSVRTMLGFEPSELMGQPLDRIATAGSATAMYNELRHVLSKGELRYPRTELKYRRRNGKSLWVELTVNLQRDADGKVLALYGIARDIEEQQKLRQQMYHLAHHDPLTNLPNRMLFFERLRATIARARRRNWQIAILYMDLDDFKEINDSQGHRVGDKVLQIIGQRLAESMRAEDTVARIGGDEFAAVIDHVADDATMSNIVDKLAAVVCEPITIAQSTHAWGVSIGYVLVSQDDPTNNLNVDPEKLLARADRNMYVRKRQSKI